MPLGGLGEELLTRGDVDIMKVRETLLLSCGPTEPAELHQILQTHEACAVSHGACADMHVGLCCREHSLCEK